MNPTLIACLHPGFRSYAAAVSVLLLTPFVLTSRAADGTWNTTTSGALWSVPGNWLGGTAGNVADGSASTASFNTQDITAATTVNLDSARTIGTLIFGDTATGTAGSWVLANNGNSANILTLAGAATITVDAMSTVSNTSSNVTISAVIDGTNGLTKNGTGTNSTGTNNTSGTGTLTLSGANTYTGATNIDSGSIRATSANAFGGVAGGKLTTNVVNIASGARLILSGTTIANTVNINGANALSVVGGSSGLSGTVNILSNTSAYVHNGGNYTLTFSGALKLGANTLTFQTTGTNNGALITGTLTGTGGITKNGNGPLTMAGDGSGYSGVTSLNSGELLVGSSNGLGTGTLLIAPPNNGSVTVRSTDTTTRSIATALSLPTTSNNGQPSGLFTFGSSNTSLNGNLTFTNTTDTSFDGASRTFQVYNRTQFDAGFTGAARGITTQLGTGTLVLNGTNTYTGGTTINAGTLQLGNGGTTGSLSTSSAITVGTGATFAVNRSNATVQGADFKSVISGLGSFAQAGGGTTTLIAGNTYTGTTTVSAGTLALGDNNVFAASNFILGGGTLAVGTFTNTAVGTLSLTGNSSITLGSGGAFVFADSHLLDWSTFTLSITGTFVDGSSIRFGTDGTGLTGAQLALISINGGGATINGSGYLVSAIPEPATYAMIAGVVLLGCAIYRRRCARA